MASSSHSAHHDYDGDYCGDLEVYDYGDFDDYDDNYDDAYDDDDYAASVLSRCMMEF